MAVNSRLLGLLLCAMPVAVFWGYIGSLVAGIIGALTGATICGCIGLFTYCLVAVGKDSEETEKTGEEKEI